MNKNVISQSDELIKLKKKYKKNNLLVSILISFLILILCVAYLLCYILSQTEYMGNVMTPMLNISFLVYFDVSSYIFDFANVNNIYRILSIVVALLISFFAGFTYSKLHIKKINKKFKSDYYKFLVAEAKINGIVIDVKTDSASNDDAKNLDLMNISLPEREKTYQFSTPMLSWEGVQYKYILGDKKRDGFLINTSLSRARTQGLIQLRTFGSPSIHQYNGLTINKYGFGEDNRIANFVCYTSLGPDIYLAVNVKVAEALADLKNFVQSDLVVSVIGDRLQIFIDGFRLNLSRGIKDKIENDALERQAEAIVALHQVITALSVALSGEITFAPESKGNGISSY